LPTSGFSFGPADARVTIVIFSDLECPYCRELAKSVRDNIPQKYPDDVRVVFKDFPLESIHKWARAAAEDGRCLGNRKPEAFWALHDWIFQHQQEINQTNLQEKVLDIAKQQNLQAKQIAACMDTHATASQVDDSIRAGKNLHIQQTPTFFVNGRLVSGAIPWSTLDAIIQLELNQELFPSQASLFYRR
jgi:protein-disulfide isomerase